MMYDEPCDTKHGIISIYPTWEGLHQFNACNIDVLLGSNFGDQTYPIHFSIQTSVMAALSTDPKMQCKHTQ